MIKIVSWMFGLSIGAGTGALIVMILVPVTGREIRHRLREGYAETMEAARLAADQRRAELEAELARRQKRPLPAPTAVTNGKQPALPAGRNRR